MIFANYYQQDRVKNASFEEIDRHHTYNPTITNRLLRAEFLKRGVELNNPDVNQGRDIAFSILHDGQNIENIHSPKYLIATENPYICPLNRNEEYLKTFNGVFTWNRDLLHLPNVSHLFIPNHIHSEQSPTFSERPIFSCLINANKAFRENFEIDLYKERVEVIRWYEKKAPAYFSLHGLGWGKPAPVFTLTKKIPRRIQRLATQLFGYKPFPSYQGEIENKADIYRKTKFAYCYENAVDLPDYISEKIFDCFFSGCVPIYWGSKTIQDYVPNGCYIDRRKFNSTEAVHQFLLGVNETQYAQYQFNIQQFLNSSIAMRFDTTSYVSTIINKITQDLGI